MCSCKRISHFFSKSHIGPAGCLVGTDGRYVKDSLRCKATNNFLILIFIVIQKLYNSFNQQNIVYHFYLFTYFVLFCFYFLLKIINTTYFSQCSSVFISTVINRTVTFAKLLGNVFVPLSLLFKTVQSMLCHRVTKIKTIEIDVMILTTLLVVGALTIHCCLFQVGRQEKFANVF